MGGAIAVLTTELKKQYSDKNNKKSGNTKAYELYTPGSPV
jgi:hypothetical protein